MQKLCAQFGTPFTITDRERAFYAKISPVIAGTRFQIPEPSLSPQARLARRMSWRNDRSFYKRKCSHSGQSMIAIYPEETTFPVYHPDIWWGDTWDGLDYGQEFSFEKPVFQQWHELMQKVPRRGIDIVNCENSYYCNYCGDAKNCYLDIAGEGNEDCYYNLFSKFSKNCVDCTFVYKSEEVYQSLNCTNCQNVQYGFRLENCFDCFYSFDLKGCNNCLFCSNLRHKHYYIFNKPYSKETYLKKIAEMGLHDPEKQEQHVKTWQKLIADSIQRDMYTSNSENCSGDDIYNSKNCENSFNITNCEDCFYLYDVLDAKDCADLNYSLYHPEMSYELISTLELKYSAFSMASHYCHNVYYCDQCENSANLFACIGLKREEYCILNKQYSKNDYEALLPKVIAHMQKTGEWGEFFPAALSPWGYNETVAQEYFPIDSEIAKSFNFNWKSKEQASQQDASAVTCKLTGKKFKHTKQELEFYQKMRIAAPEISPDARHLERLKMRNVRHLFDFACSKCSAEICTTANPEGGVKIYCEKCYLEFIN